MAIALKQDGIDDFVVLERADDLGGTWRDNTYPGCACDIPSVLYSFTDEQNPGWSRAFAGQPEIQAYVQEVARRHDLMSHLRFGHEVLAADWDDGRQRWEIETAAGNFTADVVISAAGALADPAIPELPGLDRFEGRVFHSARWDHDHDLSGRQVAVVGTGASAIQFVPEIQPQVGRLHLFQRTPPWVLPRSNPDIPASWRRRFVRHPRLLGLARRAVFSLLEAFHFGFRHPAAMRRGRAARPRSHRAAGPGSRAAPEADARLPPRLQAHPRVRHLVPGRYVPATSTWSPPASPRSRPTPSSTAPASTIRSTRSSSAPASRSPTPRSATASAAATAGHWPRPGAAVPRRTSASGWPGFPNLFMLLGPNTGLGHNSVLLMIESQIAYLRQALAHRRRQGLATLEPTPQAQARFIAEVDAGTDGSVWTAGGCLSWYTDATGRNSTLWPGSVRAYQRASGPV